jgi:glycosyltransferase involved in cell wall biosynthesis
MRVLMLGYIPKEIGGSYTTGIANVVLELCKCKRNDVDLLCFASNASEEDAAKVSLFDCCGYSKNPFVYVEYVLSFPLKMIKSWRYYRKELKVNPTRYLFYQVNMHRCIKSFKPDVIHAITSNLLPTAKLIVGDKVPCVVTFHGFHYKKKFSTAAFDIFIDSVMPLCDEVTVLTQEARTDILKSFPRPYKHLSIIPNGCDISKFYYSAEERYLIRERLGIKEGEIVFITVGNINENKGQLRFIQYLHKSGLKNYKYLIIGKGDHEGKIRSYVSENHLGKNVSLLGYIANTETFKYYSASDVYAQVSEMEGQSLSELEAESTGLRIIVNKTLTCTIPGDINDTGKYYVIDFDKHEGERFTNWLKKPVEHRESVDKYDWNNAFARYAELYREIINTNK